MDDQITSHDWMPTIRKGASPLYLAIADALAADILAGALTPGDRLPPQRSLAEALNIDFTTVSRAYAEARKRGLVEGRVGQGTYVRAGRAATAREPAASGLVDMAMNLPPTPEDDGLGERLWAGIAGLEANGGLDLILRYQEAGGAARDRAAGVTWLAERLPGLSAERLLICPGAQGALLSLLTLLARPQAPIAVEALSYPGFRSLAAHLTIPLLPVDMDAEGLVPQAFDERCRRDAPALLYCTPTLHNPTTSTMSLPRREAIVAIARHHGVRIIEDDAYGKLSGDALPPLAALAPDLVYHVAGLSKCLSPSLRIAYVAVPSARDAARLAGAIRATTSMASPIGAAIATQWIESGLADEALNAIRTETEIRRELLTGLLGEHGIVSAPNAFHAWLPLSNGWGRGDLTTRLRAAGIGLVTSDAFAVGPAPEAVRIGLGAPPTRDAVLLSLQRIADLAVQSPAMSSMVI
jgi:DNA-binding transcriptional MocR family regulator